MGIVYCVVLFNFGILFWWVELFYLEIDLDLVIYFVIWILVCGVGVLLYSMLMLLSGLIGWGL